MSKLHPDQYDFFREPVFQSRMPVKKIDLVAFRSKLKRAMSRAIRECPYDRPTIAARMAQYLGLPNISKSTLDAYTAESKETHDISIPRFKAFVYATEARWIWDMIAAEDGLTMLEGDEAHFAEIGRLQQEITERSAELRALRSRPVLSKRR